MDKQRIQEPRPSTRAIVVDEALCRRIAGFLFCEPAPITDAFLGEPITEVMAMTRWCVEHEGPTFDPEKVLPKWAAKRGRGRWSDRPNQAARIVWGEVPAKLNGCAGCGETRHEVHEVTDDHESLSFNEGDLICPQCAADHGVTL
jgi:hypothetical protein